MNQRFLRVFAEPQICKPKLVYQARINYLYLYLLPVPVPSFVLPRVPSVQAFSVQAYLALKRYPRKHAKETCTCLYRVPVLRTCTCTFTWYLYLVRTSYMYLYLYLVPVLVLVPCTFYTCTSYVLYTQLRGNTSPGGSAWRFAIDHPPLGLLLLLLYRYLRIQYLQS